MSWLLRGGAVLATAEVLDRPGALRGRTGCQGAVVLPRPPLVHTAGMRFGVDVAYCDGELGGLVVLGVTTLRPWRVSVPPLRARTVIEAQAGAFARWGLGAGDQLEVRG